MASEMWRSGATGAGLTILFEGFVVLVKEIVKENILFKPNLKCLEEKLKRLAPTIKMIDSYNRVFDRPDETEPLRELIMKGKKLVIKCSKINKVNFVLKYYYNQRLSQLNNGIERFINVEMRMNQTLDQKETLYEVKQLGARIQQLRMGKTNALFGDAGGFEGVCSPPGLREDPVGLEVPLGELKAKLLKDENSASLVVVNGLGGSGKTTLAISLCHDEEIRGVFNRNILFVCVSKSLNLMVIIKRIFQHKGLPVPEFRSKEEAVNQLEQLLRWMAANHPILLVLDDVWPRSEYILQDLLFHIRNYKILVTSRHEVQRFGPTYKLQTLSDADAMKLFCQTALMQDGNFYRPHKDLVAQIVKSCGGFPLAISVVAKSLRGRYAADWQKKAEECCKIAVLSDTELLESLERRVEALGDDVNECFRDLQSFPEDQRTSATALLDMWMERRKLEECSANENLHEIADRSLVDLTVIRHLINNELI